ncbi:MAG: glycosyltransferase family 4 protein [Firmicutes bacterium]|nr:glycosyltransferase family 4 protein [Bacillota bacterium]
MKVVWVVRLAQGGILKHLSQLLSGIGDHEIVIAAPNQLQDLGRDRRFIPLEIVDGIDWQKDYSAVRQLRQILRREQANIVHAHGFKAALITAPAVRFQRRTRVIFTAHNSLPQPHSQLARIGYRMVQGWVLNGIDQIISVSDAVREQLIQYVPERRVVTIRNGIATSQFTGHSREGALELLGIHGQAQVIGTVARLISAKGLTTLLEGVSLVSRLLPNLHLVIVGEGPERTMFEGYGQALGLGERVHFLGWRDDVPQLMAGWDCFVLPSFSEGFSLSVLEAMAAKLPVVVSDLPAMREAVVPNKSGFLVQPGNGPELAAAILNILKDSKRARAMGEFNHERVADLFGEERMIQCTRALYEGLGTGL